MHNILLNHSKFAKVRREVTCDTCREPETGYNFMVFLGGVHRHVDYCFLYSFNQNFNGGCLQVCFDLAFLCEFIGPYFMSLLLLDLFQDIYKILYT